MIPSNGDIRVVDLIFIFAVQKPFIHPIIAMQVHTLESAANLGKAAAKHAAQLIQQAIQKKGQANIILATGTSQFEMLKNLVKEKGINWEKVGAFHLDEYIGLSIDHPASFRKYIQEQFVNQVPVLQAIHFIQGDHSNPQEECHRLNTLIREITIDVAMIGIGENGHLAFNDPPADFETESPFIVVQLDEACRRQQLGEGWFPNLAAVPKSAISMSIQQIMKSKHLIVSVPDKRKAKAVKQALKGPITPLCPASILQHHRFCDIYLDGASASMIG